MRTPTEDDRALYAALMLNWHRMSAATRAKGTEVRVAFELWLNGAGPGPTREDLDSWSRLRSLEDDERKKFEALMADILG